MANDDQDAVALAGFTAHIETLLSEGGIARVELATEKSLPAASALGRATLREVPRLIVVLRGERRFRVVSEGQTVARIARAREALYVAPRSWIVAEPGGESESLSVAFGVEETLLVMVQTRSLDAAQEGQSWHHNARLLLVESRLDAEGRALCGALERSWGDYNWHLAPGCEFLLCKAHQLLLGAPSMRGKGQKSRATFEAARHYVMEHFADPIGRETVADHLGVAPRHVSRLFVRFGEDGFAQFLTRVRLEQARLLLRDSTLNMSEIARRCGFPNPNYFSRCFGQHFGLTPTQARRQSEQTPDSCRNEMR